MPMLTRDDSAAITFDHLLTFIAQCDLGDVRMNTLRLRDLISSAIVSSAEQNDPSQKFLIAALEYLHLSQR
jgi:hypothetical protein